MGLNIYKNSQHYDVQLRSFVYKIHNQFVYGTDLSSITTIRYESKD